MTVEDNRKPGSDSAETVEQHGQGLSRRAFLKAGSSAVPVVLTLQSGAALARSSNLISAAPDGTRVRGHAFCLDTSTAKPLLDSHKYDLGDPVYASINVLPDQRFYPTKGKSGVPVTADQFCRQGQTRYYHDSGWHEVRLPTNGVIVSATALTSVSSRGDILFNKIF